MSSGINWDRFKEVRPGVFEKVSIVDAVIDRTSPHAAIREVGAGGLHEQIIKHCNEQWPRWKFRHSRTDKKTHEELGVEDFTVFLPMGRTLHVECKAKGGKLSIDQAGWINEMSKLGHTVHVVQSLDEFIQLTKTP
jgi:hypothetical protein